MSDQLFNEDLEWVFNQVSNKVLEGLEKFRQETEAVNINYAKYAYSLKKLSSKEPQRLTFGNPRHLPINTCEDQRKSANLSNQ